MLIALTASNLPFSVEKDLASGTLAALSGVFGALIHLIGADGQSKLGEALLRSDATADWLTYRVDALGTISSSSESGQEYVTWQTAEDEKTCDFCGPLDFKVINIDQLDSLGYPPAHVNCRCTVVPVTEAYGRDVPLDYYYKIPASYESWDDSGAGVVRPTRIKLEIDPLIRYDVLLEKRMNHATVS